MVHHLPCHNAITLINMRVAIISVNKCRKSPPRAQKET